MLYKEEVLALREELEAIYKDLHRHPEPGYTEQRTAGIVARFLRECGLTVTEHMALTGVIGLLDSEKPGKTVMIRADMDCLGMDELAEVDYRSERLGYMHACGHDSHVTMLLGAAKLLSRHKEAFAGKIKFVFQPAEEQIDPSMYDTVRAAGYQGEGGAGFLVQEGVLDDVDACLILHVAPTIPVGSVELSAREAFASSDYFRITFAGKGGHGAMPHLAIDPVPAIAQLIEAIHCLPTREVSAQETCVISIGTVETPGSVWNAVADRAVITGGYRTLNQDVRELLGARIPELAEQIAAAHRCTVSVELKKGYRPCINDERIAQIVRDSCTSLLGGEHVRFVTTPKMGSEDSGEYLCRVPGAYLHLGIGDENHTADLHNPRFTMNLDALPVGVMVHVNNVLQLLSTLNQKESREIS